MTLTGVLLVASTCLYAGFQWTIRVLVYPQFVSVPTENFVAYEREHQRLVTITVAPLFGFFGACAIAAVAFEPGVASVAAAACFAMILLTTGLAAVPQHRRLIAGFDTATHRRLLMIDSVRLALALLACVSAVAFALAR